MKAISTIQGNLFFNTAAAGPLTSPWSAPFVIQPRNREAAAIRAARRQLRSIDAESNLWQESAARIVLVLAMVGAYATAIWQIGSF